MAFWLRIGIFIAGKRFELKKYRDVLISYLILFVVFYSISSVR
jgi:hypothetical protein